MTLVSTPIAVGSYSAEFCWNSYIQTYQVSISPIEEMASCNVIYGTRFGEFLTPDILLNSLRMKGYEIGSKSAENVFDVREKVSAFEGVPELIGHSAKEGNQLFIITPSGQQLQILPQKQHSDYCFSWGDRSIKTIETARQIHALLWEDSSAESSETFALSFAYEYLMSCKEIFSLSLYSICDWYVSDAALQTSLSEEAISSSLLPLPSSSDRNSLLWL